MVLRPDDSMNKNGIGRLEGTASYGVAAVQD